MTQKTFDFPMEGGLDLTTPPATIKPGRLLTCKNYEPSDEGGYRRIAGYERFDGLPSPSEATYYFLYFIAGTGIEPIVGDIVNGVTSTDTGEILAVVTDTGTWGVDATGWLVIFNVTGTFLDTEVLQVSAADIATANGVPVDGGGGPAAGERAADNDADDETYLRDAREARRADITLVPGEGSINGTWFYNGTVYAVRNAIGSVTAAMYYSSAASWVLSDLGNYVDFTIGAITAFEEGELLTFTGGVGGTAIVVSVGVTSGSWSGGDAAGRLYVKTITGTITSADAITAPSGATATAQSSNVAVTLPPDGKYEFRNYNFGGSIATNYIWGVNGVGRGFRYDGTDFAYIHVTGLTDALDKPEHLHAHKKQLFFSFGASLQHSGVGTPMTWNAVFGASELATGDTITNLKDQPGDVLGIFNRNRTYLLYGDDVNNWDLVNYSLERGAIEWSAQDIGYSIYADDRGIQDMRATDAYGDFAMSALSERIDPLFQTQKASIVDSVRIKTKDQYRLFYDDNTAIIMRVDTSPRRTGLRQEFTPITYDHLVTSICAEEDTDGFERVFFGSDDGYVYEAEKGESFDGGLIEYGFRLVFCHCQTPRKKKRFHKVTFQMDAPDQVDLSFYPEFSYGNLDQPSAVPAGEVPPEVNTGAGVWDTSFWGSFIWDGQLVGEAEAYISGQGINVSLLVQGESNFERQHIFRSCTYNFSIRGLKR